MKLFRSFLAVFCAFLLASCQAPLILSMMAHPGERLCADDFSDLSGHWPQASGANGSLEVAQGTYRMEVLIPHYEMLATPGHNFRDVQVEADATRQAGPLQNLFGLACRAANPKNFYFFVISSDGYYGLGKIKEGKTSLLGQEMMAQSSAILQGDGSNHLKLTCAGERLTGYVNGQVVTQAEDSDFFNGDAGLIAGTLDAPGVEVAFDNFLVTKP